VGVLRKAEIDVPGEVIETSGEMGKDFQVFSRRENEKP